MCFSLDKRTDKVSLSMDAQWQCKFGKCVANGEQLQQSLVKDFFLFFNSNIKNENMSKDLYSAFARECKQIAAIEKQNWKKNAVICNMLEHERPDCAAKYIEQIKETNAIDMHVLQEILQANDCIGGAQILDFGKLKSSPSSLRYAKHALDVLLLLRSKNVKSFQCVEIGGGYGGLALVMHLMASKLGLNIAKYIIYDLPEVQILQKFYLAKHTANLSAQNIVWCDADTCGADIAEHRLHDTHLALVSNYCISEIPEELRRQYGKNLFSHANTVYFRWNWGSKSCLPSNWNVEPEVPDTSRGNTVVTF